METDLGPVYYVVSHVHMLFRAISAGLRDGKCTSIRMYVCMYVCINVFGRKTDLGPVYYVVFDVRMLLRAISAGLRDGEPTSIRMYV